MAMNILSKKFSSFTPVSEAFYIDGHRPIEKSSNFFKIHRINLFKILTYFPICAIIIK